MADTIAQQVRAAWEEVRQYHASSGRPDVNDAVNPQHQLASRLLDLCRGAPADPAAAKAVVGAFVMWANVGDSRSMEAALASLPRSADVWQELPSSIMRAYRQDGRADEAMPLLARLVDEVSPLASRSALLYTVAEKKWERGDQAAARAAFGQVVAWNASEWHVKRSRGHLHELDHLNPGQPAPGFSVRDRQGRPLRLDGFRGRPLVLHFWSFTCGACPPLYPYLRTLRETCPDTALAMIGASEDTARSRPTARPRSRG